MLRQGKEEIQKKVADWTCGKVNQKLQKESEHQIPHIVWPFLKSKPDCGIPDAVVDLRGNFLWNSSYYIAGPELQRAPNYFILFLKCARAWKGEKKIKNSAAAFRFTRRRTSRAAYYRLKDGRLVYRCRGAKHTVIVRMEDAECLHPPRLRLSFDSQKQGYMHGMVRLAPKHFLFTLNQLPLWFPRPFKRWVFCQRRGAAAAAVAAAVPGAFLCRIRRSFKLCAFLDLDRPASFSMLDSHCRVCSASGWAVPRLFSSSSTTLSSRLMASPPLTHGEKKKKTDAKCQRLQVRLSPLKVTSTFIMYITMSGGFVVGRRVSVRWRPMLLIRRTLTWCVW